LLVIATINVVGGFLVTDRMLEMFKSRAGAAAGDRGGERVSRSAAYGKPDRSDLTASNERALRAASTLVAEIDQRASTDPPAADRMSADVLSLLLGPSGRALPPLRSGHHRTAADPPPAHRRGRNAMSEQGTSVTDRWPGPGGEVEDAIVELAELVREAAEKLDSSDPRCARELRVRATSLAIKGVRGLGELMR
jgi:hypothetical protein